MKSRLALFSLCALFTFPLIPVRAQETQEARLWLTTADRSAVFASQETPLHFSEAANTFPTIDVNDMQRFQTIDGFGFALTGGSAQLLMHMDPARRPLF